ncbi:unnamed protein product [Paramecium sonneborni]|uniref:Serine/threonine-protein phosphatase 4 regulatory subunit 3-like central domain-containing protein n=1 Tax=Paramecium sonneborni TaxID=65129 RepID=A0A8S1NHK8_9CILI|nr:unnamed protein product [Paramecium sonneborni]
MKQNSEIYLCKLHYLVEDRWDCMNTGYINFNSKNEMILIEKETSMEVFAVSVNQQYNFTFDEEEAIQFQFNDYYALSFQSKQGAQNVWNKIQNILNEEDDDESIVLTPVNENNLPLILETMNKLVQSGNQAKQILSSYLLNKKDYLDMLIIQFNKLEQNNNQGLLQIMCQIVKNIVTVSEHELFQILLSDQYYLFIFGALEYDEEMTKKNFVPHRQFFEKNAQFLQVVQIKSKERLKTIHFIYRLQYLRDCGLAYYIDECQLMLIKIVLSNKNHDRLLRVAIWISQNTLKILKNFLLTLLINSEISISQLQNFLQKYVQFLKNSKIQIKLLFIKNQESMDYMKLLKIIQLIHFKDEILLKIPTMILELVISCLQNYPINFRKYIISEHQQVLKYPLFNLIVENAFKNDLYLEILKLLIDNTSDEQNDTLNCFLSQFYPKLSQYNSQEFKVEQKTQFVEISLGLARNLKTSVKEVLILNQTTFKIGFILQENNKILQTKCLQFFKIMILQRDEDLNKQIIMALPNLISPLLVYKGLRENLIFSQLLEIIKIIYEGGNQNIIRQLEQELKQWEQHSNYQKIQDIFKTIKNNCLKNQFSNLASESKPQHQINYNVVDDEIDLFKSVQGHSTNLHKQPLKKLVDYDDEIEVISKKTKID